MGKQRLRQDGDHAAGDLEFDLVAGFEASPAPHLIRHGKGSFVSDGDGHGMERSWDSTSFLV